MVARTVVKKPVAERLNRAQPLSMAQTSTAPAPTASTDKTVPTGLRPWRRGQSGNPTGRPKAPVDIAALARQHGPKAIEVVAKLLTDRDKKLRLAAAQTLLDRGFGRPSQHVTTESETSVMHLHLVAARAIAAELPMIDAKPAPVDTRILHAFDPPSE
jgi:hypothetical protein